jgi:hypothetical protein
MAPVKAGAIRLFLILAGKLDRETHGTKAPASEPFRSLKVFLPSSPPSYQPPNNLSHPFAEDVDLDVPALIARRCAVSYDHARAICELAKIGGARHAPASSGQERE